MLEKCLALDEHTNSFIFNYKYEIVMQQLVKARYRVRIKPSKKQYNRLMQFAGCARYVYNYLLEINETLYSKNLKGLTTREMEVEIQQLKGDFDWVKDCDASALQQARIDLQRAFNNFFKGLKGEHAQKYGKPKFKSRRGEIKYRTPYNNGKADVAGNMLKLPKIGLILIKSRNIPKYEKLTSVTIIIEPSGKVYASLAVEKFVQLKSQTGENVGIDLGLESFLAMSNGDKIPPFNFSKNESRKIASMDRKLSKMRVKLKKAKVNTYEAKNYQVYKRKVAKYKNHIANKRKNALHKLTTELVTSYDVIVVEDLNVKAMCKNHKLAFAIHDASWSMFVSMLEYKCKWYGKVFHKINRFEPTSTVCSSCGVKHKDIVNSLAIREWVCPDCGTKHDRDVNAAINILIVGIYELFGIVLSAIDDRVLAW